ncbi:NUDIX domain-containing protein [Lapillicoccus sp.]|uniref:NUDIX hydrolase n=1 Tax=Lapillicoccus sp. TaxID=1909287 RepID=UPI0025DB65E4|nr:NUDIX domain-containing protein [Lapillicoccus sp.]
MAPPPTAPVPAGDAGHPAYGLLHADAERLLRAYQPADGQQELVRLDLLAHLAAHPDAMARSGPPAHFTASCLVLDPSLERVLLTHHRKADQWFQFGGHLEVGDRSVRAGAQREALEESGVEGLRVTPYAVHLDRHALVGAFGRCAEHLDIRYAAVAPQGARPAVSAESLDVRWWSVDALPGDGGLARPVALARQALAGVV